MPFSFYNSCFKILIIGLSQQAAISIFILAKFQNPFFDRHLINKVVCHTVALPFTLKSILRRQKKTVGNSNISPCQNIIFKKIL
jgi:hypothetical protein